MPLIAVTADELMTPKTSGELLVRVPPIPEKKKKYGNTILPIDTAVTANAKFTSMVKSEVHVEGLNEQPDLEHDDKLPNVVIPNLAYPPGKRPKLLSPRSRSYISIDPWKFGPPGLDIYEKDHPNGYDSRPSIIVDEYGAELYAAGTKVYALNDIVNPPLEESRQEITITAGSDGIIMEGEAGDGGSVGVEFEAFEGLLAFVDKDQLGLGTDPKKMKDPGPEIDEKGEPSPRQSPRSKLNLQAIDEMEYGGSHNDIADVNKTYKSTDKLNPYPALSQIPPFEVHFERASTDVPWSFSMKQIAMNDESHTRVWNNYIKSPRMKPSNIFIIDTIDNDPEKSEIQQWNEFHANEYSDFYHTVHKNDRVLKVNNVSSNDDPKKFFQAFQNATKLTMVVQKRDVTREMEIMKLDIEHEGDHHLGAKLKMGDGRFFSFEAIEAGSVLEGYNNKQPGFILPGDKILGCNRIAGEAHCELLEVLKKSKKLELVLGRTIVVSPRKGIVNFVNEGETFEI